MTRQQLLAYQKRAGIVGAILCCTCLWPVEKSPTSTGHALTCGAHRMLCEPAERALLGESVEWRQDGGGVRGNCPTCGVTVQAVSMEAFTQVMAADHRHDGGAA